MGELRLFVAAVLDHWGLVLTGSVVSAAGLLQAQYGATDQIPNWIFWTIACACLLVACFRAWRDEHRARVKAEHLATREIADLKAQLHASDPAVKAFNETRANDIRSGADIEERPLGLVVYLIVTTSAWGRWQAAQHQVDVDDQRIFRAAQILLMMYLEKGQIPTRGYRNGDRNNREFISPDWWGQFYFKLEEDSWQIYKASIYPRTGVDAAADPSYTEICCDWPKVRALFPKHDEKIDAITSSILSSEGRQLLV